MFMLARRLSGGLLVIGFIYFFVHGIWDPRPIFSPPSDNVWGMFSFMTWLLTFAMIGAALLCGRSAPGWFNAISLLAGLITILFLFNWNVPPFVLNIHSERDVWLAYLFNVVPAVQFLSWAILGRHTDPDQARMPAEAHVAVI